MEMLALLRTLGALGVVLGMLTAALWIVRRYDIKLPGRIGGGREARVELVQKLALDNRRTLALIRRDGREHLILLAPEGAILVEGGIAEPGPELRGAAAPDVQHFAALLGQRPAPPPLPLPDPVPAPVPQPAPEPAPTLADVAEMLRIIVANRTAAQAARSHV